MKNFSLNVSGLLRGFILANIMLAVCHPVTDAQVVVTNQFTSLTFNNPVGMYRAGDGTDRLFVVEQTGKIKVFPNIPSTTTTKVFLNIQDSVSGVGSSGEMGLLGLAFHPQYSSNGYFYISYTMINPIRTRISRFQVSASNPDSAVRSSELVLIEQLAPGTPQYENHKGGQLVFGPDGDLYIGIGDGGSAGDPFKNGQSDTTLLAKILRIDVNGSSGGKNYAIPADNPYVDSTGKKKEIFIKGVRNPWRFSFDAGTLWVGDVGQDLYEEIDTVQKGRNYGWNTMEGFHCFNPSTGCNQTGLTLPIFEYGHTNGRCSITGGFVYRGANIPQIAGQYIYADYCSGEVFLLDARGPGAPVNSILVTTAINIGSFGVDKFNEVYVCGHGASGKLYKVKLLAPDTAKLVSPSNIQTGVSRTPTLIWRSGAWAASYRLQVSTDSTFATTAFDDSTLTDTSKQIGPLGVLTKYYWRVRAKNSGGSGVYSIKRNFTTLNDVVPPPTPVLLAPSDGATNQPLALTLLWSLTSGAATYRVQLSADSTFSTTLVDDSTLIDTSKNVGGFTYLTPYYWRVLAKNSAGVSGFSTKRQFTTIAPPPPPSVPVLLSPGPGATDQPSNATLRWSSSAGATTYRLQIALDSTFATMNLDDSTLVDTSYQATTLTTSTLYYWRALAKNTFGTSVFSSFRSFTTAPYSASYHLQKGWNLLSLPLTVRDGKTSTLFPTAISHAYRYTTSYLVSDSLVPGIGYWMKFADSQHVIIAGVPILDDTVNILTGWNMIGTITNTLPVDSTMLEPPGISNGTFFGYAASYFQASSLQPSRGYWIKATAPGKIVIHSSGSIEMITGEQPVLSRPYYMK